MQQAVQSINMLRAYHAYPSVWLRTHTYNTCPPQHPGMLTHAHASSLSLSCYYYTADALIAAYFFSTLLHRFVLSFFLLQLPKVGLRVGGLLNIYVADS